MYIFGITVDEFVIQIFAYTYGVINDSESTSKLTPIKANILPYLTRAKSQIANSYIDMSIMLTKLISFTVRAAILRQHGSDRGLQI